MNSTEFIHSNIRGAELEMRDKTVDIWETIQGQYEPFGSPVSKKHWIDKNKILICMAAFCITWASISVASDGEQREEEEEEEEWFLIDVQI